MPPLSPIGYSVTTRSLSPCLTCFGQVEREPEPRLRIPSQWHCLMEVTARPGFHLFKTDPGYLKPIPATMIVFGLRPRRAGGGERRGREFACLAAGGRRIRTLGPSPKAPLLAGEPKQASSGSSTPRVRLGP